jgi:uncharacterized protein YjdB
VTLKSGMDITDVSEGFTSSGTFTVPTGVHRIIVECWGGGGGGGNAQHGGAGTSRGGGGAGGAYTIKTLTGVSGNYTVTVGSGGSGGNAGSASWFGTAGTVYAQGGVQGANGSKSNGAGGNGSSASSIGDQVYAGGNGGNAGASGSGGGGGGAGSTGTGNNAVNNTAGAGRANNGGAGGAGVSSTANGISGQNYGGGGSGAMATNNNGNQAGGSGAPGYVLVSFPCTNELTSAAGTDNQSVCVNTSITDITYFLSGDGITGATVTPLPTGVSTSFNSSTGILTISGTPAEAGTFNYTVTPTGGTDCTGTTVTGTITVFPVASVSSVTGTSPICIGSTATYTANDVILSGGTGEWSSDNTAVATVNASGMVTGVSDGTANIIFTIVGGCGGNVSAQQPVTITENAAVSSVSGTSPLCIGAIATYSASGVVLGGGTGTWSSSNTAVATVNATSGEVTAVGEGTADIVFTITGACNGTPSAQQTLSVIPDADVASVGGTSPLCIGATATWTATGVVLGGGTGAWSSSDPAVATVDPVSGLVTAVSAGTTNISYTISGGCNGTPSQQQELTVTPDAAVSSVTGVSELCINANAIFSANGVVLGGGLGAWSSSNTAVATVNASTGEVTAIGEGTADIIYTITGGCNGTPSARQLLTVTPNAAISSVTGTSPLCTGTTETYTANGVVPGGGTGAWSSSNISVATVNATTGEVNAVGAGTANIIYTVTGGCGGDVSAQQEVTVNPNAAIASVTELHLYVQVKPQHILPTALNWVGEPAPGRVTTPQWQP